VRFGARVSIAFGTDNYQKTSDAEASAIGALGLFSPLEILRMWSVVTPTMIFSDAQDRAPRAWLRGELSSARR
jgi:hypothetical protein